MAREPLITQADVSAVADRIQAAGGKPTARAVREALGVASMATVLKYLQVWQGAQAPRPETPPTIPPQLERLLAGFIGQEVATARAVVEEALAAEQANGDLIVESERQAAALVASEEGSCDPKQPSCAAGWPRCPTISIQAGLRSRPSARLPKACVPILPGSRCASKAFSSWKARSSGCAQPSDSARPALPLNRPLPWQAHDWRIPRLRRPT